MQEGNYIPGPKHFPKQNESQYVNLSFASSGDNTIISGIAGDIIVITKLALGVSASDSVTAELWNGPSASGTAIGTYYLGSMVLDLEENPILIATGKSFVINLSSAVTVSGSVAYIQGPIAG